MPRVTSVKHEKLFFSFNPFNHSADQKEASSNNSNTFQAERWGEGRCQLEMLFEQQVFRTRIERSVKQISLRINMKILASNTSNITHEKNETTTTASAILLFFCVFFSSFIPFFGSFLIGKGERFLFLQIIIILKVTPVLYFFLFFFTFILFLVSLGLKPTSVTQAGASAVLQDLDVI